MLKRFCSLYASELHLALLLLAATFVSPAQAQESPYIVTYDHYLEAAWPPRSRILLDLAAPSARATIFTPSGPSSNTAPLPGGPLSFISMARPPSTTAPSPLASAGRTAFACC